MEPVNSVALIVMSDQRERIEREGKSEQIHFSLGDLSRIGMDQLNRGIPDESAFVGLVAGRLVLIFDAESLARTVYMGRQKAYVKTQRFHHVHDLRQRRRIDIETAIIRTGNNDEYPYLSMI